MDDKIIWKIIGKYFNDNPNILVDHHLESYNDFFKHSIFQIFKEKKPIRIQSNFDSKINDYRNKCIMYFGGKDGNKVYLGKPIIYDDNNSHYMFPNEARLRNMTYGLTIHYDIDIEFYTILDDGELPTEVNINDEIDIETETAFDYNEKKIFKNVKEDFGNLEPIEETTEGGAKKKKIARQTRNKKPYKMTTSLSAEIKKATEESMIDNNIQFESMTLEKIYLGKIPIMLQSDFCILSGLSPEVRQSMGECKHDFGGYFIINGKEKTVICQEKFADNALYVRTFEKENKEEEELKYLCSARIVSASSNVSKPKRTFSVHMVATSTQYTNKNIVVEIPNVRQAIPLFIVFRALGIISDKAIIEMCLLDMDKHKDIVDLFIPSIHDAGGIISQKLAIEYISTFIKGKRKEQVLYILSDYFLPHIGETNYTEKAYYLGYMVHKLLCVHTGIEKPTDRDHFKYKRIELIGSLLYDLFSDYFTEQQKIIRKEYDTRLNLNKSLYGTNLKTLISSYKDDIFKNKVVDAGISKAFKGNWGAYSQTKRIGVVQDLNRLSFNGYLSHLRKTNLPLNAEKLVPPRLLHSSQWGFIDPMDTPDGGNIGLHKALSISTYVSRGKMPRETMIKWLRENISMKYLEECGPKLLSNMTKIIINGYWAGAIFNPIECVEKMRLYRRNALLPIDTSITFEIKSNIIHIYNDAGRLCRPIFYKDFLTTKLSIENSNIKTLIKDDDFSWNDLVTGFNEKKIENFDRNHNNIYELFELYDGVKTETNPKKLERFIAKKAILDYIDCSESEDALIALNYDDFSKGNYTHMEINESLILGILGNQVIFPENNQAPRNMFSCGQTKQVCSIYHSNYQLRMDKSAMILHYGQIPLVKSRYLEYFNKEEMPYGENTIVAIMCYGGYNMEDSVLINEGALHRGLFNTSYFTTYETHEELKQTNEGTVETKFKNIESVSNIIGKKPGYNYDKLDSYGIIKEGTIVDDKTILIGITNKSPDSPEIDMSKTTKKGQLGIVDKCFITEGIEGERIAKVRIREIRIPNLGDKMASRAGQKGTVGLVVHERDMPFTKDGIRPDIIINPHAIPSRMTVGQLVECITGKACAIMGGFSDCTAFVNKGSKVSIFGNILSNFGYHSSGNDILYNGMTGEQIESEIFMGPTYYMRLKHMVKDKINYRARGPITAMTRQSVSGRANDGGLRIGEMERDAVASHGIVDFMKDTMMERADKYKMAICNNSGMIAICNPSKNLFLSPMCDGPIRFSGSIDGQSMNIENVSKYGRDFSIIEVPYSLKVLIQELMAINVQFRIITESNIEQIESMSYSKNILELSGLTKHEEIRNTIKKKLDEDKPEDEISPEWHPMLTPPNLENAEYEHNPDSPDYPESPESIEISEIPGGTNSESMKIDKDEFVEGEEVVYIEDDANPKSIWTIVKKSPNFITIQRNRDDDEINPEKDIKVVRAEKIARPGDFVFNTPDEDISETSMNNPTVVNPALNNMPYKVNIAPVINVLGGNENKDIQFPAQTTSESIPMIPEDNNIVIRNPTSDGNVVQPTNTIESAQDIANGGFVIKKSN